jgi:uncharacterized protein YyaL (SSP411 family)
MQSANNFFNSAICLLKLDDLLRVNLVQGFHRYSTDEEWHVPHFEKMLYDQAQLAVINLDAFQVTAYLI